MMADQHVLAIDVGNTRAKFGLFRGPDSREMRPLQIVARVLQETPDLANALQQWWETLEIPGPVSEIPGSVRTMIAGSQPDMRDRLLQSWPLKSEVPRLVSGYQQIPVAMDVDVPARVGVDRLLNVFAAGCLTKPARSVIVVDSGTATTIDLMTSDLTFRGGSILPGLRLSAYALHDYTARLPLLDFDSCGAETPDLPGRNTEEAMKAGLFFGQLGAVREITARLCEAAQIRFGEREQPLLFVTGGGGRQLVDHLPHAVFVDSLPLHGLAMLAGTDCRLTQTAG